MSSSMCHLFLYPDNRVVIHRSDGVVSEDDDNSSDLLAAGSTSAETIVLYV